jgi:2-polyprenyl-6-methoxyphenol hydroxylase-like FAD-dependent oxidoreductase
MYLRTIYGNIKDKSKVLVGKVVASVEQSEAGVTVVCEDGSSYQGDILVGADGVRSTVREEMWRLAETNASHLVEHDRKGTLQSFLMYAEIICLPMV